MCDASKLLTTNFDDSTYESGSAHHFLSSCFQTNNEDKSNKSGAGDEQNIVSRKQSASDLQSRLKTRKLLGVGELAGDNGDVYKSKISQLLGINESLYVRLPRGLSYWNALNTSYFILVGACCLVLPKLGVYLDNGIEILETEIYTFIRLYGVVLASFGVLFRSIVQQRESRSDIATFLLIASILHLSILIVVTVSHGKLAFSSSLLRITFIIGNLFYHGLVDCQGGLHRQLYRVIEDLSFLTSSPVAEKKPIVDILDTTPVNNEPIDNEKKIA